MTRRERFETGQRFRSVFGGILTITADWHYPPTVEEKVQADAKGLLFYTVTYEDGHQGVLEHGVIENTCTPLPGDAGP
ncbi:hypothetical protein SD37_11690 [Amycolatopsis orientalis]|uniref:Uncharacterized protein n=1 Tax=Amycolatopsis orientalis TaxID=31958 RepID=A0A193BVN5_AMYOR|nr:hypothetical protein [Amycolatopsis orientalis]ANN16240.1 hypothetical protein SD37_11690 [Amycolatopsis orientalis]